MFKKWRAAQSSRDDQPISRPSTASDATEAGAGPSPTSTTATGLGSLVDSCRRIASLRDRAELHRTTVEEAIRLTNAEAGAFIVTPGADPGKAQFVFQSHPQLFVGATLGAGLFRKTLVDREAVCEVAIDEPTLALSPIALAIAPAVAAGGVVGLIVVLRPADEPFGNTDLEVLNMLAPAAGSAHVAASSTIEKAEMDETTRLGNRRRLDRDFIDLTREGKVGFAVAKIDFFAEFRTAHGATETEELLRELSLVVRASIRPDDVAYRSADDEFGILLPDATKEEATWVAERVRQAVAAATVNGMSTQPDGHITMSIGVAAGENDDPQELTERALAAMHEAEEGGHDQVVTDEAI